MHTCYSSSNNYWSTISRNCSRKESNSKENDKRDEEVISKNCAPVTDCIRKVNDTQVDNTRDLNVVIPMYNLLENTDNYSKTSGSLQQYYSDEPGKVDNAAIIDFKTFKCRVKISGKKLDNGNIKDVDIAVVLKYLGNFGKLFKHC